VTVSYTIIAFNRKIVVHDAGEFEENKHPRGQPGNAGQFGSGGGGSESSSGGSASESSVSPSQKIDSALKGATPQDKWSELKKLRNEFLAAGSDVSLKDWEKLSAAEDVVREEKRAAEPKLEPVAKQKKTKSTGLASIIASVHVNNSDQTPEDVVKEATSYLDSHKNLKKLGVSVDDVAVVQSYIGDGYKKLNKALRSSPNAAQQQFADQLNSALDKLPPHIGEVYRLTKLTPEQVAQLQPGTVYSDPAFTSTSAKEDFLQGQTGDYQAAHNTDITIKSKTGKDVSSFQEHLDEAEVLFKSGTKFRVVSNKRVGKRNVISVEEV
jgi:hypothetical protein